MENIREKLEERAARGTKLTKAVVAILQDRGTDDEVSTYLKDVVQYGCVSGMVSELIYYDDTIAWYQEYMYEISQMLVDMIHETGMSHEEFLCDWDFDDPLALDTHNQNLLAWFSFEEICCSILRELEDEGYYE